MGNPPYRLSEGLFLEDKGKLLPWYKSLHQLAKKGGKSSPNKSKVTQIAWDSESILGGLKVSIQAYQQGNGIFFIDLKHLTNYESVQKEYESTVETLKEKLGEPNESGFNFGYPWVRWRWGKICINITIAERFMDYVAFSISNDVIK
jgi:hypothetical protein